MSNQWSLSVIRIHAKRGGFLNFVVGTVQNEEQSHTLLFLHYSMGKTDIVFFVGGGVIWK